MVLELDVRAVGTLLLAYHHWAQRTAACQQGTKAVGTSLLACLRWANLHWAQRTLTCHQETQVQGKMEAVEARTS